MALLPKVFAPEDAEDAVFSTLPAGWYEAELVKSELKTTKDGAGKYLAFKFKVINGKHDGRFVFTNINIVNKNDIAVRIAQSDLKAICTAIDFTGELEDTIDLHDQPMLIKVSVKPETSQWPEKNEIKGYKTTNTPF